MSAPKSRGNVQVTPSLPYQDATKAPNFNCGDVGRRGIDSPS
ncbi:hypothetical protein [Mastigocoleus testarum]|nr:hypothetical protein [Mastigocoleus testarum]